MSQTDYLKKFKHNDSHALAFFVANGYVVYDDAFDITLINACRNFFLSRIRVLKDYVSMGKIEEDYHGWSITLIDEFYKTSLFKEYLYSRNTIKILKEILGPDIAILGYDTLFINAPTCNDPVLKKSVHTDTWTGTSVNSIMTKVFLTDVDAYNGLTIFPGSHLQGIIPVRNRSVDPALNLEFREINLENSKAGDFIIWHPLLLHSTTGNSDKNIRMSITSRYTSTETDFSSQERALGYKTIKVGPMNQIKRLVGNDHLTPLRTYGGYAGIDRRLSDLYEYGNYEKLKDYSEFLKGIKSDD